MSQHRATIAWSRDEHPFEHASYSRNHEWRFDDGPTIDASAAPGYKGDPSRVDPEEALVASIASCHMLTFLAVAAKAGLIVDRYLDEAEGRLDRNEQGKLAVTEVTLHPRITFGGAAPDEADLAALHEKAHHACFIANSVRTRITVEP